jgi:iron complex transport system ATP-binding protein
MGSVELLQIEEVSYRYRQDAPLVLREVSLQLEQGASVALLGPNGAGKSTLLDLCLGWKRPEAGRVLLAGREMQHYSRREMGAWISLVPQNERVRFDYTVLEYLLLGRTPYLGQLEMPGGPDVQVARDALATVGIPELSERPVTALSGGEHQLMMIARALVQEPRILVLDEPTSQLDPGNRLRIVRLLHTLREGGSTLLFTTHDPNLAAECASHAVLIKEGRILKAGPEAEVLTGPALSELYSITMEVRRMAGRPVVLSPIPQRPG